MNKYQEALNHIRLVCLINSDDDEDITECDIRTIKHLDTLQELVDKADKFEKALYKACEELASMEYKLNMSKNPFDYDCDCKDSEEWKEWLLQDEQIQH